MSTPYEAVKQYIVDLLLSQECIKTVVDYAPDDLLPDAGPMAMVLFQSAEQESGNGRSMRQYQTMVAVWVPRSTQYEERIVASLVDPLLTALDARVEVFISGLTWSATLSCSSVTASYRDEMNGKVLEFPVTIQAMVQL